MSKQYARRHRKNHQDIYEIVREAIKGDPKRWHSGLSGLKIDFEELVRRGTVCPFCCDEEQDDRLHPTKSFDTDGAVRCRVENKVYDAFDAYVAAGKANDTLDAAKQLANLYGVNTQPVKGGGKTPPPGKQQFDWKNIVANYFYTDADGKTVYKVLRDRNKEFMQGRPDPDKPNKWIWNLKGVNLVPYNLPMLLDAKRDTVFVVEGGKDADKLNILFKMCRKTNCIATTSSGGAGSGKLWGSGFTSSFVEKYHLTDKQVIVMPDNDEKGLIFGREVCKAFVDAGCQKIKMVLLPVKDIYDLIKLRRDEGISFDNIFQEIRSLCKEAELVTREMVDQWNIHTDKPELKKRGKKQGNSSEFTPAGQVDPATGKMVLDVDVTKPTAEEFVQKYYTNNGFRTLYHINGTFYSWHENLYKSVEPIQKEPTIKS